MAGQDARASLDESWEEPYKSGILSLTTIATDHNS